MKTCPECGSEKFSKLWALDGLPKPEFKGWYCADCNKITKPTGREYFFEFTGKDKNDGSQNETNR